VKKENDKPIQIAGAGLAGLAAAITLAQDGRKVVVHEAKSEVGHRFAGDLQGLENWSEHQDVLAWMRDQGLPVTFSYLPCRTGEAFDAWGNQYRIGSQKPLFYMIERGPGKKSLDTALLERAISNGVEVEFGSRLKSLSGKGILATGPKAADAIAVGYHFETSMDNGFWLILDNDLAPDGYSYLLIMNGRGTVKSCMFRDFKNESLYVGRTVDRFQGLLKVDMKNQTPHGGAGNLYSPAKIVSGVHPMVGEHAGFQDSLWGFGMRIAIQSGILAAQCIMKGADYEKLWRSAYLASQRKSAVNRVLFGLLGNQGFRRVLKSSRSRIENADNLMYKLYKPTILGSLLYPWARLRIHSRRKDASCNHVDCNCIWCRHGNH